PRVDRPAFVSPPPLGAAARGTETLLVVEDEAAVRGLMDRTLKALGYTVVTASSGDEALARLASGNGPIHLLVTDVVMPGSRGRALAETVAPGYPGVPPLSISGSAGEALGKRGLPTGASLLDKPYSIDKLARRIRELLDAR